jgi:hypothetical protein
MFSTRFAETPANIDKVDAAINRTALSFGFGLQPVGMGATDRYLLDRSFALRSQESRGRRVPSTPAEPEQLPSLLTSHDWIKSNAEGAKGNQRFSAFEFSGCDSALR